jgi:hydrogenase maturation protein HypF
LIARISERLRDERKLSRVVLSGGVFQNKFLSQAVMRILSVRDFAVIKHRRVPANDGSISLG